jgi:hypothetical protein
VNTQEPNQQNVEALLQKIGVNDENRRLLSFLIKDSGEFDSFKERYWKSEDKQLHAYADYHRDRIKLRALSLLEFSLLREGGKTGTIAKKVYLEELFQQPIDDETAEIVSAVIDNDISILDKLYDFSKANVGINVRRAIRRVLRVDIFV